MASTFLEPGGDADFSTTFWTIESGAPVVATDFVHGSHIKSYKYPTGATAPTLGARGVAVEAGGRFSSWIYLNALPTATNTIMSLCQATFGTDIVKLKLTSAGVLTMTNGSNTSLGTGATLSTGQWYRICYTYTITSTTVNHFITYVNGASSINVSNTTLGAVTANEFYIGNAGGDTTLDMRSSDHYIDNATSLTDTGNIWVTAKRPFSNGTTTGFSTSGTPSGYGSGHAPYVNYRPLQTATANVNVVGAGSAVTEEYNIESISQGDINITGATIVDYMGWLYTKALIAETGSIIVNGVSSNISITTTASLFTKIAGSTTYPAGTGSDLGEITSTTVTTVTLYDAGIIVAYIPSISSTGEASWLSSSVSQPFIDPGLEIG